MSRFAGLALRIAVAAFAGLAVGPGAGAQTPPASGAPAIVPAPAAAAAVAPSESGAQPAVAPSAPPAPVSTPAPTRLRPTMATPMRPPTNATPYGVGPAGAPAGRFPRPGGPPAGPGVAGAPGAAGAAGAGDAAGGDEEVKVLSTDEVWQIPDDELLQLEANNMALDQALDYYAGLVRRVLLRPPQLAGGPITIKFTDLTREEAIEAFNAVFALNSISVIPVRDKFLKVVPSQQAPQEGAKATAEDPADFSELGQFITKLVKVTKVKPGDIAQAVQQFQSGKVQNAVLAFDDQNFFVLRDMSANVKRMVELIKELDVTPEFDYKLEVIPIRYGKVDEIFETLNGVLTGSSSGGFGGGSRTSSRASGFRSGSGTGLGTGTGVGGQFGTQNPLSPQQSSTSRTGMTSPGAARSSLADRLRSVTAGATGGAAGGAQFNILENARIIPDMRSNSLLVYASKEEYKMLTNIVAKIDTLLAQVLIESIILEVGIDTGKDIGVSMVQNPKQFGNWTGAGSSINDANIATNILSSLFNSGFSYFGQYNQDFAFAVRAMATDSKAKVLARPRIQTTHAQPAQFAIGDTVPYPRSSQYGYGFGGGRDAVHDLRREGSADVAFGDALHHARRLGHPRGRTDHRPARPFGESRPGRGADDQEAGGFRGPFRARPGTGHSRRLHHRPPDGEHERRALVEGRAVDRVGVPFEERLQTALGADRPDPAHDPQHAGGGDPAGRAGAALAAQRGGGGPRIPARRGGHGGAPRGGPRVDQRGAREPRREAEVEVEPPEQVEFELRSSHETHLEGPRGDRLGVDRQISGPGSSQAQLSQTPQDGLRTGRVRGSSRGLEREGPREHPDGLVRGKEMTRPVGPPRSASCSRRRFGKAATAVAVSAVTGMAPLPARTAQSRSLSASMKKIVRPARAAAPVGPYSHAVRLGQWLFCSGQIPLDPASGQLVAGDIKAQTERVLENIRVILEDQGLGFGHVVKTTVFMTHLGDFAGMNEVYARYFAGDFPARSTVQVAALPRGAAVEIEVVAAAD